MIPAIMVPELNGNPILFTKNNSKALKYLSVKGNRNLNTNTNTNIDTRLAIINFLTELIS